MWSGLRRPLGPNPPMRSGLGVGTRGEGRGTRRSALDSDIWGRWRPLVVVGGADGGLGAAALGRGRRDSMQGKTIAHWAGATLWVGWVVRWTCQAPSVPSGRQWQGSQSSQGASELSFPRPALWQMQSEAAGRAGEPSGQGEEAPPEGPGGHHPLAQTDARGPACQVMGQHLDGQPCGCQATVLKVKMSDRRVPFACGVRRLKVPMTIGGDTPKGNGTGAWPQVPSQSCPLTQPECYPRGGGRDDRSRRSRR